MKQAKDQNGRFMSDKETIAQARKNREKVGKQLGYENKSAYDYIDEMKNVLEVKKLIDLSKANEFGFEADFLRFLGFSSKPRNYRIELKPEVYKRRYNFNYSSDVKRLDFIEDVEDAREVFTPLDDFYGTPSGGDAVNDYGRVPTSHLMAICSYRLGVANRVCNGTSNDVFRNGFDFVKFDNPEKIIERADIRNWMQKTRFIDKVTETYDFEMRTGLGHLIPKYMGEKGMANASKPAPRTKPVDWESFSAYHMTPANAFEQDDYDYDKQKWDFIGGTRNISTIHHSRVYVWETRRVEGGLRGLALPEIVWTPLLCYLNTMYYILKSLGQLGTNYMVFESAKEYPTTGETQKYIELSNLMRANKTIVVGKNGKFMLENAAAKIGGGIESYLEFLREDMCSGWIYPKNQLFGRSDGGGLDGAGAIVSKDDYLGSNLSTKQLLITNDMMYIFKEICGFKNLENVTLRWNIDLHKTEEQRLNERILRAQAEMTEIQLEMSKLNQQLYKKQVKLQIEMVKVQNEQFKRNPEMFMEQSQKDEENIEEKKPMSKEQKKDFLEAQNYLSNLQYQYNQNQKIIDAIQRDLSRK